MHKYKIYVDGQEGTTGLQINERLETRTDIEILKIDPEKRKDTEERRKLINSADIVFLCLPDAGAKEAAALVENPDTRVIDASTAHRTDPSWVYGLPELNSYQRDAIRNAKRVSVPGCYATGFILALNPLVKLGVVPKNYPVTCHAVSGYSGGGKKTIELYEKTEKENARFKSPRFYALGLNHKHLPEMQKFCGLDSAPLFTPIISDYYKGMSVAIPLVPRLLSKKMGPEEIHAQLTEYYKKEHFVKVMPFGVASNLDNGYLAPIDCNNTNVTQIFVFGHSDQVLVMSRLDNLGKGSSGAAVQVMNIMLGAEEGCGLE